MVQFNVKRPARSESDTSGKQKAVPIGDRSIGRVGRVGAREMSISVSRHASGRVRSCPVHGSLSERPRSCGACSAPTVHPSVNFHTPRGRASWPFALPSPYPSPPSSSVCLFKLCWLSNMLFIPDPLNRRMRFVNRPALHPLDC
jgi:hypothetical protein